MRQKYLEVSLAITEIKWEIGGEILHFCIKSLHMCVRIMHYARVPNSETNCRFDYRFEIKSIK